MASIAQIEALARDNRDRILLLQALVASITTNTVVLSRDWLDVNSSLDLTNKYVFGKKAGINNGDLILGWKSIVPTPTTDADFELPLGISQ